MSSPLQEQVLSEINSIRDELYGTGFTIKLLKFNGVDRSYDDLIDLTTNFIPSFDRTGNIILMLISENHDSEMREATHLVFDGWVYQLTEPAKPNQGPLSMWKATGRPMGSKYVVDS